MSDVRTVTLKMHKFEAASLALSVRDMGNGTIQAHSAGKIEDIGAEDVANFYRLTRYVLGELVEEYDFCISKACRDTCMNPSSEPFDPIDFSSEEAEAEEAIEAVLANEAFWPIEKCLDELYAEQSCVMDESQNPVKEVVLEFSNGSEYILEHLEGIMAQVREMFGDTARDNEPDRAMAEKVVAGVNTLNQLRGKLITEYKMGKCQDCKAKKLCVTLGSVDPPSVVSMDDSTLAECYTMVKQTNANLASHEAKEAVDKMLATDEGKEFERELRGTQSSNSSDDSSRFQESVEIMDNVIGAMDGYETDRERQVSDPMLVKLRPHHAVHVMRLLSHLERRIGIYAENFVYSHPELSDRETDLHLGVQALMISYLEAAKHKLGKEFGFCSECDADLLCDKIAAGWGPDLIFNEAELRHHGLSGNIKFIREQGIDETFGDTLSTGCSTVGQDVLQTHGGPIQEFEMPMSYLEGKILWDLIAMFKLSSSELTRQLAMEGDATSFRQGVVIDGVASYLMGRIAEHFDLKPDDMPRRPDVDAIKWSKRMAREWRENYNYEVPDMHELSDEVVLESARTVQRQIEPLRAMQEAGINIESILDALIGDIDNRLDELNEEREE